MKKALNHILKTIAGFVLLFNIISLIWVIIYAFIPIPITKLMVIEGQEKEVQYEWRDLDQISGRLQLAVMCAEDQYFLLHNGLDFRSIKEAEEVNKRGGNMRGASTITQQVAKNVFLWPDRTYAKQQSFTLHY